MKHFAWLAFFGRHNAKLLKRELVTHFMQK
jgi:hypothetical protein